MISSSGSFEKSCSVMCYKNYLLLSFETSSSIVANVFVRPEVAWNGIVRQAEVYTMICLWDKQHCIKSVCETSSSLRPTAVQSVCETSSCVKCVYETRRRVYNDVFLRQAAVRNMLINIVVRQEATSIVFASLMCLMKYLRGEIFR